MIERAHIEFMKMGMAPNMLQTIVSSNTKSNRTTTKELSEY